MNRLLAGLALGRLLGACNTSPSQNPSDEPRVPTNIDSFDAFPNPVNVGTQFTWTVFGNNLRCTLDVDSNGTIDYTVENCTSRSRVNHTYPTNGQYIATLYLAGSDGLTDEEKAIVRVLTANIAPNIVQLGHQPVTTNPLSLDFTWTVEDADQHITQCQLDTDSDGRNEFDDYCHKLSYRHTYAKPGKYTTMLRACDPYSCVEKRLPVRVPYNTPPVINSLEGVAGGDRLGQVSFVVSDADDDTLQCKLQVSTIGTFTFNNCDEALRNYKFDEDGSYPVTLKVTDGLAEVSKSVVIKFGGGGGGPQPEPPLPPLPVCDYNTWTPTKLRKYAGQKSTSVAWAPNGQFFASTQIIGDETVTTWNVSARPLTNFSKYQEIDENESGLVGDFWGVTVSPDSQHIAAATETGEIWFWNTANPASMVELSSGAKLLAHTPNVQYVSLDWSSKNVLVSGGLDGLVKLWNVANPASPSQIGSNLAYNGEVYSVVFSRGGTRLAIAGADDVDTVKLWVVSSSGATLEKVLVSQSADVEEVAWSPMADQLAIIDSSGAKVFDVATGAQVGGNIPHSQGKAVTFSPDGSILATTGFDTYIRLWRFDTGTSQWVQVGTDLNYTYRNYALDFSPDGKYLAVGDYGEYVQVWNWEGGCTGP